MPGYQVLSNIDSEMVLKDYLGHEPVCTIAAENKKNTVSNPIGYTIDKVNKTIVITQPVSSASTVELINSLKACIELDEGSFNDYNVLCGLVGPGATEQHIVTAHFPPQNYDEDQLRVTIFDSKTSNVQKLFYQQINTVAAILGGLALSILPNYHTETSIEFGQKTLQVSYNTLGTQSFFDGVSCGYHTAANLEAAKALLKNHQEINRDNLLNSTTDSPVLRAARILRKPVASIEQQNKIKSSYLDFIKKAWIDTYMPLESQKNRQSKRFQHYFLGYPQESGWTKKALYFGLLGFIFIPVHSLIKLPTEFLLNFLSETANYIKNALIAWCPTNAVTQSLRSLFLLVAYGLQGLFKGGNLAVRVFISPVTSFKAVCSSETEKEVESSKPPDKKEGVLTSSRSYESMVKGFDIKPTTKKEITPPVRGPNAQLKSGSSLSEDDFEPDDNPTQNNVV
ncbi:hypothetical protein [Legionella waltersii]|uniref:Uncharacterized protein n=1 Tax=Legionella waltersii TaxID=66969 RepID=A0A0W1A084_9GAMM|nr:hypothetical protein [Legionella waltersii]KTD74633.1 hypothetical protein Lwal_2674 [Legionella waltersii]SNV08914.1 Uncharacterised protein [Legionella waltersii]